MKKPYSIIDMEGNTAISVTDGDRTALFIVAFSVRLRQKLAIEEARRVRTRLVKEDAAVWVLETIDKYIQTLR